MSFPGKVIQYEMRLWSRPKLHDATEGAAIYGENGWMMVTHTWLKVGVTKVGRFHKRAQVQLPQCWSAEHCSAWAWIGSQCRVMLGAPKMGETFKLRLSYRSPKIIPAATVLLVISSTRMKLPVRRLRV